MDDVKLTRVLTRYDGNPVYSVKIGDTLVGFVQGHYPTFERRTPGKRYVNTRWKSRRRYFQVSLPDDYPHTTKINFPTRDSAVSFLINSTLRQMNFSGTAADLCQSGQ